MKADLHLHTTCSDGAMTPTQVVRWAKNSGLELISITDHDSVSGVEEAIAEGEALGIKVIPGIEISSFSNCEIHILGYNIDYRNPDFKEELEGVKDMRKERNAAIFDKLNGLGINLDIDPTADGIGRLNMARQMVELGFCKDINDAFENYLGSHGKVYTEVKRTTPLEAVRLIGRYGGLSSLAHPKKYLQEGKLELLVSGLKIFRLGAIETDYPTHTEGERRALKSLADRYGLLQTGGSDFHGEEDRHFSVEPSAKTLRALKVN